MIRYLLGRVFVRHRPTFRQAHRFGGGKALVVEDPVPVVEVVAEEEIVAEEETVPVEEEGEVKEEEELIVDEF